MRWAFCDDGFSLVNWGPFKSMFGSLLMTVVQFLCLIVYFIETVFWTLIRGVKMNDGSYRNIIDGLLFNNANLADNSITTIAGIIILIAIGLVIIAAVIAVLKSQFSTKDEDRSPKIIVIGVVKAILLMVVFPIIVYCLLLITNALTNAVCTYAQYDMTAKNSFANQLFYMFSNNASARGNWFDPKTGERLLSFTLEELNDPLRVPGDNAWVQLKNIGFVNGTAQDGLFGYNYILAQIILILLFIALFKAVLLMVRRIFDVIVLYVIAPLPIACYPSDDGKRYDIWKELISGKIVSAFGLGITFVIYSILITIIYELFTKWAGTDIRTLDITLEGGTLPLRTVLSIVYMFVIVCGAFAIPNMYIMLSHLVSPSAGTLASQDMQNMANDAAFFQRAGRGATKAAVGATGLALGLTKTALVGNKDMRYLYMMSNKNGNQHNAVTNGLYRFAAGGILGSAIMGAGDIKKHYLSNKAEKIRSDAIANYDNKEKLKEANEQLHKMHAQEVTPSDVFFKDKMEKQEAAADKIAKKSRGDK